jgi:hypothetical protein
MPRTTGACSKKSRCGSDESSQPEDCHEPSPDSLGMQPYRVRAGNGRSQGGFVATGDEASRPAKLRSVSSLSFDFSLDSHERDAEWANLTTLALSSSHNLNPNKPLLRSGIFRDWGEPSLAKSIVQRYWVAKRTGAGNHPWIWEERRAEVPNASCGHGCLVAPGVVFGVG